MIAPRISVTLLISSLISLLFGLLLAGQARAAMPAKPICVAELCLAKPALRVVALNWSAAEMLLSLGVVPVGVTDIKGYKRWQSNHPEMPDSVVELGRREEPSLAAIAALEPDLIVGYRFRHNRIKHLLDSIAPTYIYQQYPNLDQADFSYFKQQQQILQELAVLVNKAPQAQALLQQMHQVLAVNTALLAQQKLTKPSIAFGKFVGMGYGLRLFGQASLVATVANELGLNYQWHQVLPGKDFTHLQLAQLPQITVDRMILVQDPNQLGLRMVRSPVWQHLPFVANQQLVYVEPLWSFGGPISVMRMTNALTQALTSPATKTHPSPLVSFADGN